MVNFGAKRPNVKVIRGPLGRVAFLVSTVCVHEKTKPTTAFLVSSSQLAVMVHRCLGRRAPSYLADYCVPVSTVPGRQHMRSASRRQLIVPRVRRSTFGARAFAIVGPTVWNSLPDSLRDPAVGPDQF